MTDKPVCEKCGAEAVQFTRDRKQDASAVWQWDGELRARCAQHRRKAKFTHIDGRVEGGQELGEGTEEPTGIGASMARVMAGLAEFSE